MVLADSFYYQPVQIDTINTRVNADLFAKEGDANGRGMVVQITENGIIKDTTGITLRLQWSHISVVASGFTDFEVVDATKGLYKVKYPTSMLHRGRVEAFIRITDNGILSGTRNLMITVERMVGSDETIEAADDFSALQTVLTRLSTWETTISGKVDTWEADMEATKQLYIDTLAATEAGYQQELVSLQGQLAETSQLAKTQAHPFDLSGFLAILNDENGVLKSDANIRKNIDDLASAKVDSFSICVEVMPSLAQKTAFESAQITQAELVWNIYPSVAVINQYFDYAVSKGLKVGVVKFHCLWAVQKSGSLNLVDFVQSYSAVVLNTLDGLTNKPEHATILNEAGSVTNTNTIPAIQTLLTNIKSRGYETGLCGYHSLPSDLLNYVDNFYLHLYPTLTQKGVDADYDDGFMGWQSSFLLEKLVKPLRKNYPTKPIIISEAGASFFWEALAQPEKWWGGTAGVSYDASGKPAAIFADGAIKYFLNTQTIKELHIFWTDSIPTELMNVFLTFREGKYL